MIQEFWKRSVVLLLNLSSGSVELLDEEGVAQEKRARTQNRLAPF